jgi:hypothetical protein
VLISSFNEFVGNASKVRGEEQDRIVPGLSGRVQTFSRPKLTLSIKGAEE